MAGVVWIADWELQCCGEPFAVGDVVSWRIRAEPSLHWPSPRDAEVVGAVAWAYDHHSDEVETPTSVAVRAINAVYQRFEAHNGTLVPLPGSTVLQPRTRADGREQDDGPLRFIGYTAEVELSPV